MIRIAHKHPQVCWNRYLLLKEGLDLGRWISSLGCHLVQMVVMLFSPCVDCLTKYTVLTAYTLGSGELSAKQVAQLFF